MPRRNLFLPLMALAVTFLFAYGLVEILLQRYERGDIYPPYSTLRADPLGTRAFYEALEATGHFEVSRGLVSLHRELAGKPETLFYLGLDSYRLRDFSKEEIAALDEYVRKGGRVVITLRPEKPEEEEENSNKKEKPPFSKKGAAKKETSSLKPSSAKAAEPLPAQPQTREEKFEREEFRKARESEDAAEKQREFSSEYERTLTALWGFGWNQYLVPEDSSTAAKKKPVGKEISLGPPEVATLEMKNGLEAKVPWKSSLFFERLEPEWQVIYSSMNKPVFIRRSWGQGKIIVSTDSYFISNEALRDDRRPKLLSFVAGTPGRLLFDETHLGTEEQEGIMILTRKFRLEGYLYGMICVAALFLWRNSSPLVPPRSADPSILGGTVSGKDSRSGLVNLLRRNISQAELLKICVAEWKRSLPAARRDLSPKTAQMESVSAAADTTQPAGIVEAYRHLRKINAPSRAKGSYATKS